MPIGIGSGAIAVGYLCLGLRWQANNIWITASDGTGSMVWNLPTTDPDYVAASSGKSIGDILKQILDQHSTQLTAIGITGYTLAELTALTVVPPEPVTASGRLWDSLADILTQWMPNHAIWSDAAGLVHVNDTSALPSTTLTLDTDPVTLESITKDHSEAFTQVTLRGAANVQGAYLSLGEGTLAWDQLPADEATFTILDFYSPKGAADAGPVSSMTSTTLTLTSDDPTQTWGVNDLSTMGAYVWAFDPVAVGIGFSEQVTVTANTSLSAGGSMTITVDPPFNNSGYTRFQLRGNRTVQALTWRKLKVVPTWVAQHLVKRFNHSFPWSPVNGLVVQTMTATGVVCWSSGHTPPYNEFPWPFEIVPYDGVTDGYLILNEPAPKAYSSQATLQTPGASVGPDDLKVLVPYSLGPLSVTVPSSGGVPYFDGSAYSVNGVQRTLYRDYPQWLDSRNTTDMTTLANEILKTVHDTVYEGSLTYHGKATAWLTLGKSLNIARYGGTTGWESIAAAVKSVTLQWPQSGADIWRTGLQFSSRRRPFSGDRLYLHPAFGSQGQLGGLGGAGWNPFGLTTQGMLQISQARQQQFEEQYLTPPSSEQDDLGITFDEPGQNTYKGKQTEADRMQAEQHTRRLDREAAQQGPTEAEKMREQQRANRAATEAQHGGPTQADEMREQQRINRQEADQQRKKNADYEKERTSTASRPTRRTTRRSLTSREVAIDLRRRPDHPTGADALPGARPAGDARRAGHEPGGPGAADQRHAVQLGRRRLRQCELLVHVARWRLGGQLGVVSDHHAHGGLGRGLRQRTGARSRPWASARLAGGTATPARSTCLCRYSSALMGRSMLCSTPARRSIHKVLSAECLSAE